jgi:hypothetical protein
MYPKFNEWQKKQLNEQFEEPVIELPDYIPPSHRQDEFLGAVASGLAGAARTGANMAGNVARAGANMAGNVARAGAEMARRGYQGVKNWNTNQIEDDHAMLPQIGQGVKKATQGIGNSANQVLQGSTSTSTGMEDPQFSGQQGAVAGMSKMGGKSRKRMKGRMRK